ncbi:flagellar biosynthesis protein FlhB [soil metagenome]
MSDQSDRDLPASAKKLAKAKSEGQVARSRDLGHFCAIFAAACIIMMFLPRVSDTMKNMLADSLRFDLRAVSETSAMGELLSSLSTTFMFIVVPIGVFMMVVGAASCIALGGWVWTFKPLMPNFGKFNPLTGITRMISKKQLADTLKSCVLALILGGVGAMYLRSHLDAFANALNLPLNAALAEAGSTMTGGLGLLLLVLAAFAIVDVPIQRKVFMSGQKMSHQEVKQEHKEAEGNAEVKGKMRQKMRELSQRRMIAAVPKADLVVMNPTHYAVALQYVEGAAAPVVVAKGADLLAMKIRDVARDAKVPVLQAPVLARALYAHAEVDREIPAALFSAVAQVLAYVYQLRAAMTGRSPMPGALPELNVPRELDPHDAAATKRIVPDEESEL